MKFWQQFQKFQGTCIYLSKNSFNKNVAYWTGLIAQLNKKKKYISTYFFQILIFQTSKITIVR